MKDYPTEIWKKVKTGIVSETNSRLEVSNYGRVRTFNKASDGNILNGGMVEGYKIIRMRFYSPRDEKTQKMLNRLQKQVLNLSRELKSQKNIKEKKTTIEQTAKELKALKRNVSKKFQSELKSRAINYQALVHRLVATYFLPKPKAKETIVAHLDYEKLNNRATNLRWMTPEENYEHQKGSPYVIAEKKERRNTLHSRPHGAKLTVTKVMLLKKMLNEGRPLNKLAKTFKITETQIVRIRRGENWGNVPAAK